MGVSGISIYRISLNTRELGSNVKLVYLQRFAVTLQSNMFIITLNVILYKYNVADVRK